MRNFYSKEEVVVALGVLSVAIPELHKVPAPTILDEFSKGLAKAVELTKVSKSDA